MDSPPGLERVAHAKRSIIVLESQRGTDTGGYAGLEDEVDRHWGEQFKAVPLSTLLGVGAELGSGFNAGNGAIIQALRRGAGDSLNQTGPQGRSAQSQHSAYPDDTAWISAAGHRQSRPGA
jgi:type IV secretory pathway VirB10-like protein